MFQTDFWLNIVNIGREPSLLWAKDKLEIQRDLNLSWAFLSIEKDFQIEPKRFVTLDAEGRRFG